MSSLDVFPTLAKLAGAELPNDRVFDGRDASEVLLNHDGKSKHDFLFFYGTCQGKSPQYSVTAVRHGKYKAHWCTAPGIGQTLDLTRQYDPPLLFDIESDPSEAVPLNEPNQQPKRPEDIDAMDRILKAYAMEVATFEYGQILHIPDGPGESPGKYGVCCDRSLGCNCTLPDDVYDSSIGIFRLGSREHHEKYHKALREHL